MTDTEALHKSSDTGNRDILDPRADGILNRIAGTFKEILKENMVGIYVHGSLAFGCFRWDYSDIDFLVVVRERPDLEEKEALVETLLRLETQCPRKGVEMSVVLEEVCATFVHPTPFELHFSNGHRDACRANLTEYCRTMNGVDRDLAAHFTVVRAVGRVLCGQPVERVFGNVPREAYLDSIRYDVERAGEEIRENPVYIILNLCRVLAFLKEGTVLSKEQGGRWGMENLPDMYLPVVEAALQSYCSGQAFPARMPLKDEFAGYMTGRIFT